MDGKGRGRKKGLVGKGRRERKEGGREEGRKRKKRRKGGREGGKGKILECSSSSTG